MAKIFKVKTDNRPVSTFKLVFFCGSMVEYLNASLVSVYKNWDTIPEIIIVTDGTPTELIKNKLIKWPQKIEIQTWEYCCKGINYQGKDELYQYAAKNIWGKKFSSICYYSEKYPILYSDTDILWFAPPIIEDFKKGTIIKMCQDVGYYYSTLLLDALQQQHIFNYTPLNAGLIYANGNISSFPQWQQLTNYLVQNPEHFSEQTAFAILNNYFNPGINFKREEIFIQIDDMYSMKYTKKYYPKIWARHYVNLKSTCFWRDFVYLLMGR